jgi:hypothetical protein
VKVESGPGWRQRRGRRVGLVSAPVGAAVWVPKTRSPPLMSMPMIRSVHQGEYGNQTRLSSADIPGRIMPAARAQVWPVIRTHERYLSAGAVLITRHV